MTEISNYLWCFYNMAFLNRNFDEELIITWLDDNNYILGIICFLYIIGVIVLCRWMKNKPPTEINPSVLPTWNALFGILNLVMFLGLASETLGRIGNMGWTYSICNFDYDNYLGFWICAYILSKFVWLVDVVFFVLKKKTLTPFRLYHHISLLVYCWFVYAKAQGLCRWLATLNSFTTFFFYAVPFLISTNKSTTRIAMQFMIFLSLLEVNHIVNSFLLVRLQHISKRTAMQE